MWGEPMWCTRWLRHRPRTSEIGAPALGGPGGGGDFNGDEAARGKTVMQQ